MNNKTAFNGQAVSIASPIHSAAVTASPPDNGRMLQQTKLGLTVRAPESERARALAQDEFASGKRLAVSIEEARHIVGLSRTTLYALAKANRIAVVKVGRRTLVTTESLRALIKIG
jgi:excisionase family DNA binding protein